MLLAHRGYDATGSEPLPPKGVLGPTFRSQERSANGGAACAWRLRPAASFCCGWRFRCVLADAGYGLSAPFRQGLRPASLPGRSAEGQSPDRFCGYELASRELINARQTLLTRAQ